MPRYRIVSGEMDRIVEQPTVEEACAVAVKEENASDEPAELGLIMEITEIVGEVTYYSSAAACRAAGLWRETRHAD